MKETNIPREIDWLIGHPDGDVWIVGRTGNRFCAPDDPTAKSWTVLGQIGTNTAFSEKFDSGEVAEARANEARSAPYNYMEKVLRGLELHDWESDMARNALAGERIPDDFKTGTGRPDRNGKISMRKDGDASSIWLQTGEFPDVVHEQKLVASYESALTGARHLESLPVDDRKAAFDAIPHVKKKRRPKPSPQSGQTRPKGEEKEPVLSEDKSEMTTNPIFEQLKLAEVMLRGVYQYRSPAALIFTGPPGIGKSTVVRKIVAENGLPWRPWRPSAAELINVIRKHHTRGNVLVFDDYDEVWSNREQLSIFKIALDTQAERILSRDVRGPNRVKPFRVDCGMVFISNKNFDDPGDFSPAIWSSMIPAIKQRCAIMSLSFERRHVIDYTLWLAIEGGMLKNIRFKGGEKGDLMLSRQKAYEVLEFVDEHLDRLPDLTPRTLEKLALVRLHPAYAENWRAVAGREVAVRAR